MKEIIKIYEALLNRKDKVCHKSEIIEIIIEYKKNFRSKLKVENVLKYLGRHKYIERIFQSYYYVNSFEERKRRFCSFDDKELLFIVLNKLNIKWYIGLQSAFYLTGKAWQVSQTIHILNNSFSGKRNIHGLHVRFSKIKDSLFFGLTKGRTRHGINYFYSSIEKTYLDMVYLKVSNRLIKNKKIKIYLKYYPKWVGKK